MEDELFRVLCAFCWFLLGVLAMIGFLILL